MIAQPNTAKAKESNTKSEVAGGIRFRCEDQSVGAADCWTRQDRVHTVCGRNNIRPGRGDVDQVVDDIRDTCTLDTVESNADLMYEI